MLVHTVQDGRVWIVTAVEHGNGECVGTMFPSAERATRPSKRLRGASRNTLGPRDPGSHAAFPCAWTNGPQYSQVFQNVAEMRMAIGDFVDCHNAQWRFEKNGFLTTKEAREAYALRNVAENFVASGNRGGVH